MRNDLAGIARAAGLSSAAQTLGLADAAKSRAVWNEETAVSRPLAAGRQMACLMRRGLANASNACTVHAQPAVSQARA